MRKSSHIVSLSARLAQRLVSQPLNYKFHFRSSISAIMSNGIRNCRWTPLSRHKKGDVANVECFRGPFLREGTPRCALYKANGMHRVIPRMLINMHKRCLRRGDINDDEAEYSRSSSATYLPPESFLSQYLEMPVSVG